MLKFFPFALALMLTFATATRAELSGDEKKLIRAVVSKNAKEVAKYLKKGVSPDTRDQQGTPVVTLAVQGDFSDGFRALVDHRADLNQVDVKGRTALFFSVSGSIENALFTLTPDRLVSAGAKVDVVNYESESPLNFVINQHTRDTPFDNRQAQAVISLARAGYDIKTPDSEGYAPLHNAAIRFDYKLIQALVQAGADLNSLGGFGKTPLVALLDALAGSNIFNHEYSAADHRRAVDCARALMSPSSLQTPNSKNGWDALGYVVYLAYFVKGGTIVMGDHAAPQARIGRDLVEELLSRGVDSAKSSSYQEQTTLTVALRYFGRNSTGGYNGSGPYYPSSAPIVRMIQTASSFSSLDFIYAALQGFPWAIQAFLDRKLSANVEDGDGISLLMYAVRTSSAESVKLLLDQGACVLHRDKRGRSVLDHYNEGARNRDVLQILEPVLHNPSPCVFMN